MDFLPWLAAVLTAAGVPPLLVAGVPFILCGVAAVAAALIPRPAEGSAWAPLRAVLDAAAWNLGHAANGPRPAGPPSPPPAGATPRRYSLALLVGLGLGLAACAVPSPPPPPAPASAPAAAIRAGADLAHALAGMALGRADLSPAVRQGIATGDAVLMAAVAAWLADPGDSALARDLSIATAAAMAGLSASGLVPGAGS